MNELNDIIIDISMDSDILRNEQKDEIELTEEDHFNNLIAHFKENLKKRLYKKTLKEIDSLIESDNNIERYSYAWKIYILRIRAILSIIKNKIRKYLVMHFDKTRTKYHIMMIKKYLSKVLIEFNNFYNLNEIPMMQNNFELINDLLYCYLDYIWLISFFHKKLGNIIESISYLSYINELYNVTLLIPKTSQVHIKLEMGFIALIKLHICNEDYSTAFDFLNIAMDICFKNIIYQTKDLTDGVFTFGRNKPRSNYEERIYNIDQLKKIILNIIFIFLFRSICYENTRKIINAIKCDCQSIWFFNHFYIEDFQYFYNLIKNILDKRLELKNELNYIEKKIAYYEKKRKNRLQAGGEDKDGKNAKNNENQLKKLYSEKYDGLVNKLENLKIPEIDITNAFESKKNLKRRNSQGNIRPDKNNYLYSIKLYNTYLREDFRPIIDNMEKIKSFDIDYQTQEKIQKYIRIMNFEQYQKNMKLKKIKSHKKNLNISLPNFKTLKKVKTIKIKKNILKNKSMPTNSTQTQFFSTKDIHKTLPDTINNNNIKLNSIKTAKNLKNTTPHPPTKQKKKIPKYKIIKATSICDGSEVYKENEKLNKFFNKKYLEKRAFIKKLESRELLFQKDLLKAKDIPKISFTPYNEFLIRRGVEKKYRQILSISVAPEPLLKENLSKKEYHKMRIFNRLENNAIKSLNTSALVKFKEEERKMRYNKKIHIDENDRTKNKIKEVNKSMIEKININLEEIIQRENIETNNFIKLYNNNKKFIKHRNERNSLFLLKKNKEKEKTEII